MFLPKKTKSTATDQNSLRICLLDIAQLRVH